MDNARRSRRTVRPPSRDSDSDPECSIHSDAPFTEAEIMEMNDMFEMASAWRTTSSMVLLQGQRHKKAVASR